MATQVIEVALPARKYQHLMPLRGVLQRLEQAHEPIVVGVDHGIVDDQRRRRARVGEKPREGEAYEHPQLLLRAAA